MKHISEYLDEAFKELFEERAAIMEHDGQQSREEAEKNADDDCRKEWAKRREVA